MRWLWFLVLTGCTLGNKDDVSDAECVNSVDCPDGKLCRDGECQVVECLSSSDCDLEYFCADNGQCEDGCASDDDCLAGDSCDVSEQECEAYECRNTELDCDIGEFCDEVSGSCYDDAFDHCESCNAQQAYVTPPDGAECIFFEATDACTILLEVDPFSGMVTNVGETTGCGDGEVCGAEEYVDVDWNTFMQIYSGTCYVTNKYKTCSMSSAEDDCPRGFDCWEDIFGDNTGVDICFGDCEFYLDNGYL